MDLRRDAQQAGTADMSVQMEEPRPERHGKVVLRAYSSIVFLACRKKPAGAMWTRGARKPSGGRCWAEVYCGSAESGSWVHVDPLSGVVDR